MSKQEEMKLSDLIALCIIAYGFSWVVTFVLMLLLTIGGH